MLRKKNIVLNDKKALGKEILEAGDVIKQVVKAIGSTAHLMSDIAQASDEQADGIQQVNTAVSQMDIVVQQNAELVVQLSGLASHLESHAHQLTSAVAQFNVDSAQLQLA